MYYPVGMHKGDKVISSYVCHRQLHEIRQIPRSKHLKEL